MQLVNARDFHAFEKKIREEIRKGAVFIYPTDTIYGIGCNALNAQAVARIRLLKQREQKPFSVIAPSQAWIQENLELSGQAREFVQENLPGPYTVLLKMKNKKCISLEVTKGGKQGILGVRVPRHWFTQVVHKANVPFVTTSANKTGEKFMTSLRDCDKQILASVDCIVYDGVKKGKPSTIIDFTSGEKKIVKR
ncbi:threonylcarbamoyl-AMP synthase [Candidatus Micrarchaeota archaeon]|nr:threonylcarbamoyl-AMP synthase [Candidatus Micrarchaeota archaeon]